MAPFRSILAGDLPPGPPLIGNNLVFYAALGGGLLALLLLILWVRRGRRAPVDPESGLLEDLSTYPPPGPGPRRLFLRGEPMRLRLVVVAPLGKRPLPADGAIEPLLDEVLRGLGEIARQDRPRIRIWPAQLSHQGFGPTFFRLTRRPEPAGRPSCWVLMAGPVRGGAQQFLLGLALCADEPSNLGNLPVQATEWDQVLRIGPRREANR
ncbi:MAG TPA: hypothetical protein VH643_22080 [Gemmataceae bacterium]|jgi:hypothetical protein